MAGRGGKTGRGGTKNAKPGKAPGMKIKKGDHVVVTAGKDNGREGTVIVAYPERQKVLVQGVNMIKKNTKVDYQGRRGAKEGGIVNQEAPIHISNVQLVDPDTKKPTRAGYRFDEDKNKIRVSRASGKDI
jgi:large subunit ribosomal protein L24